MSQSTEARLWRIPLLSKFFTFLKGIPLGKGRVFSLYDLLELYTIGIVRGALTYRASAISYSFFVAIFPFFWTICYLREHISSLRISSWTLQGRSAQACFLRYLYFLSFSLPMVSMPFLVASRTPIMWRIPAGWYGSTLSQWG